MAEENKKAQGPIRVEVGKHMFRLTGASVKSGKSNPDSKILHLSISKVLPNGDIDEAYKPLKEFLGVEHPSSQYMEVSAKKADSLLKLMGIEEGLSKLNGDISVLATKAFKKEFGTEEFEAEVYEEKEDQSFTNEAGKLITFKARRVSL